MFFFSVDPTCDLIDVLGSLASLSEGIDLHHGLSDGSTSLLDLCHKLRIIKNATGYLAVTSTQAKYQMQSRFFLDIVIGQSSAIFQLLSGKNQTLLVWRNALLILDLGFDIFNRIGGLDLKSDGLASQGFHENLHFFFLLINGGECRSTDFC